MVEPGWANPRWETWRRLRSLAEQPEIDGTGHGSVPLFLSAEQTDPASGSALAKASIDALIHGAHRDRQGEDYLELLRFVGRFRKYAPFNAMLVDLQRRGTRYVLTAEKVAQRLPARAAAGSTATGDPPAQGPLHGCLRRRRHRGAAWCSPTTAGDHRSTGIQAQVSDESILELWDRTVNNAVRDGIRVTLVDHGAHSAGMTYWGRSHGTRQDLLHDPRVQTRSHPLRREIEVNRNLALIDRYATLIHELAHIYCGHLGTLNPERWPDRRDGTKSRNEIEAESITYMLIARLDAHAQMGDYILGHAKASTDTPSDIALNLMFKVAGEILEMAQRRYPARASER